MQISFSQFIQLISGGRLFYTLLVLSLFISLSCNGQVKQITYDDVKEIADRNASELWGNVDSDDPIPYYGPDDEIIAYHFNYALDGDFPDKYSIVNACKEAHKQGNRALAWGNDSYGNMVVGANSTMPVFIEYSKCLSKQYALGSRLEQAAEDVFGTGYEFEKTYYLGLVDVWFCVKQGNVKKYINLEPAVKILEEMEFREYADSKNYFWERDNFNEEWAIFLEGTNPTDLVFYIPGYSEMPFLGWSYGCTPSSAAMLLAWWDNYHDYGNLIDYYMTRWDGIQNQYDHHVPWTQKDLAEAMGTNTSGSTSRGDICDGYEEVVEDRGYNCSSDGHWAITWTVEELYDDVKDQIDADKPVHISIENHSIIGIGYNHLTKTIETHDPNWASIRTITRSMLEGTYWVNISNNYGSFVKLESPHGSTAFSGMGSDHEVTNSDDFMEIRWISDNDPSTYVKLYYHTEGGFTPGDWVLITNTPNDGVYNWHVPEINCFWGNTTEYARIKIEEYNQSNDLIASDGSYGNFEINDDGGLSELTGLEIEATNPDYYSIPVETEWWMVCGVRDENAETYWDIELYENSNFTDAIEVSNYWEYVNYVVLYGTELPYQDFGIKIMGDAGEENAHVQFESENNNLTPNSSNGQYWYFKNVVNMWDIHLTPGNYYFELDYSDPMDLDMGLFKSGGDNTFSRDDAVAASNNVGLAVNESFHYNVQFEGDYGLCVNSNTDAAGIFFINILDVVRWTGAVSSNWHLAVNWAGNIIPDYTQNVVIPDGCPNYPSISFASALCNNLTIESGASIKLYDKFLVVYGDLSIFGELSLESASSFLEVYNSITWENGSSAVIVDDNATIACYKSWYFNIGADIQLDNGTVKFITPNESYILNDDPYSYFHNVVIDKTTGSFQFHSLSKEALAISGNLEVKSGSNFSSSSENIIVVEGSFISDGSITLDEGTLKLIGYGKAINLNPGSYLNNMTFNTTSLSLLNSDLHLGGDFKITSGGVFTTHDIYVAGSWINYAGPDSFVENTSKVVFNGDGDSYITNEEFYTLELNGSGNLRIKYGNVTCENYNWENGDLWMESGTFTINDLVDQGIFGTIYVEDGTLNIHQDATHYTDLNCELFMYGGNVNIFGGTGSSYWGYMADAEILIDGGTLDFNDISIHMDNSASYALGGEITAGLVRTQGNLICAGDKINIPGGTFELYGASPSNIDCNDQHFFNLNINKEASKNSTGKTVKVDPRDSKFFAKNQKANTVNALSDIILDGDLIVTSYILLCSGYSLTVYNDIIIESAGTLNPGDGQVNIYGDWTNNHGAVGFTEGFGLVNFLGTETSTIYEDESFYNLEINKSGDEFTFVTISDDNTVTVFGDLTINACSFKLGVNSTLNVNNSLIISENANLYAHPYANSYINVGTNWDNQNTTGYPWANGFYYGNSTVSFNGLYDDQFILAATGNQEFYNLKILKPIAGGGTFMPNDDITVYNNTEIVQGSWDNDATGLEFSFYGNLEIQADGSWDDDVNTVNFLGPDEQWCINHGVGNVYFDNFFVIKETSATGPLNIEGGLYCYYLWIQEGELQLNSEYIESDYKIKISEGGILNALDYSRIHMADQSSIAVHGGGILRLIGNGINNPEISHVTGYYSMTIYNSGILEANYTRFEYMDSYGINIMNDGIISDTYSLNNCEFRRGEPGGTLLTFATTQSVDILNAEFPPNTWGSAYNVTKSDPSGEINFIDATGNFSGWDFENDPYDMVNWEGLDLDVDLFEFLGPASGILGSAEIIMVYLASNGELDAMNIPISYSINGEPSVTEIIPIVGGGGELDYYFTTPADLSQPGVYEIVSWIAHPLDQNPYNDTISTVIQCYNPNLCIDNLYSTPSGYKIEDFYLNTINHIGSGMSDDGYGDFAYMSTDLVQNGSYTMGVSGLYGCYVSMWIDLNDNYLFDASEILASGIYLLYSDTIYSTSIDIPATATPGQHRMRVRLVWNESNIDPCATYVAGEVHDYTVNIISNAPQAFDMDLKVYFEGPFNGTDMNSDLTSVIPLSQPYNMAPWNYNGTETVSSVPTGIVDWILCELRDAPDAPSATSGTLIAQQAAFLKENGSIAGLDGIQVLHFNQHVSHELFVVIRHRNHLDVMSALPLPKLVDTYSYDFTTASNKTFAGVEGAKEISPGIWGMVSGDGDADGFVSSLDNYFSWGMNTGKTGYNSADFNLNEQVDNNDKNDRWLFNINYECQVPE